MATVQSDNSGTGVIIGILIAVLLAVGAYFLIKQDNSTDLAATPAAAVVTPGDINVDATINPVAPPAAEEAPTPAAPDVNVNVDTDSEAAPE